MICLQSNEISTPFLHLSFFLEQYGLKASPLFMANRVIFASLFLVARVMFDSYIALGGVIAVTQVRNDWFVLCMPLSAVSIWTPPPPLFHGGDIESGLLRVPTALIRT